MDAGVPGVKIFQEGRWPNSSDHLSHRRDNFRLDETTPIGSSFHYLPLQGKSDVGLVTAQKKGTRL